MRLEFIHNLRGVAIVLILMAHTIAALPFEFAYGMPRLFLLNSSVIFVMVGGFLFNEISHKYTYKHYIKNKIKFVLVPYAFLSFPAALLYILGVKTTHVWVDMAFFNDMVFPMKYLYLMVTGAHLGPLWFIPMIFLIYFLFPMFMFLKNNCLLGISFIIFLLVAIYLGRPENNSNNLQSFFYFLPVYIFGMLVSGNKYKFKKIEGNAYIYLAVCIAFLYGCYNVLGYGVVPDILLKLLLSSVFFLLFYKFFDMKNKTLNLLANLSFYIYFIHGYFAGAVRIYLKTHSFEINSSVLFLLVLVLIILASIISYYILRLLFYTHRRILLAANV